MTRFSPAFTTVFHRHTLCVLEGGPRLQRLFSTFPNRWPGVGLLLLRSAAGFTALLQSVRCLSSGTSSGWEGWILSLLGMFAGILLIVGLVTPVASSLLIASSLGSLVTPSAIPCHLSGAALPQTIVIALAIGLLGPGAISFDSRLFGRREIIIPDSDSTWPSK